MNVPEKGSYGVGMMFFTNNEEEQKEIEANLNAFIEQEGQKFIGWRTVPIDVCVSGKAEKRHVPLFAKYLSDQARYSRWISI